MNEFEEYFGFTPEEVQEMLDYYGLGAMMPTVQEWYDGYLFGSREIYNPWSILNFVKKASVNPSKAVRAYWSNTSGNDILGTLISKAVDGNVSRNDIERLLDGEAVVHEINENMNYRELEMDREAIWNLLFFTGYLKTTEWPDVENNDCRVPLVLVNREIDSILKRTAMTWNTRPQEPARVMPLVQALENGNALAVQLEINDLLLRTVSFKDRAENFYHGFIAGLLSCAPEYDCLSNRESGDGISDIRLQRKDRKSATVIEVKMAEDVNSLERMAQVVLEQAIDMRYADEMKVRGFGNIHVYGISCFGKKYRVIMQETSLSA